MDNKTVSSYGVQEWVEWCRQHLSFVGSEVSPDHPFEDFCISISVRILVFNHDCETVRPQRTGHHKREIETLRNALAKARTRGVFSGRVPNLFIHLLIKCCETECCYKYKKGTVAFGKLEANFIAELANLLFWYTGRPFEYEGKSDLLCRSVEKIFKKLGLPNTPKGIRYRIRKNILAGGRIKQDGSPIQGLRPFSHSELKKNGGTPANLPFGYIFAEASVTAHATLPERVPHSKFEHSPLAKELNNTLLPALPKDLLHPDLCLWWQYISEKLCESRNDRARILCQLAEKLLGEKDLTTLYTEEGLLYSRAIKEFEKNGQLYSPQEVLGFIRSGVQLVFRNDRTGIELRVHADIIPDGDTSVLIKGILELQDYVFDRFEPRLVDFIPMARPGSFDRDDDTPG